MRSAVALLAAAASARVVVVVGNIFKPCDSSFVPDTLAAIPTVPPSPGTMGAIAGLSDPDGDGFAPLLLPPAKPSELITLSRTPEVSGSFYVPVGRAYDGNEWERSAGPDVSRIAFSCCHHGTGEAHGDICQVYVPFKAGYTYHLTRYEDPYPSSALGDRGVAARFLERSTFGPTPDDVANWDYTNLAGGRSFVDWITDQMSPSKVDVSSHREFYRRRTNPRSTEAYRYGLPGPGACEANAR